MNQTAPLLLEIGCEDLPARYVMPLADALSAGITHGLGRRGVAIGSARTFATPRRIAVLVADVAVQQPDQAIEAVGPALSAALKDGQPTPAALGFARKCGVEFSALGEKNGKLHYAKLEKGKATASLLPEIFEETLKSMDELVPKRMRWGSGEETFVRPVQWLLALLGPDVVPLRRFDLESGRLSYGHRFHAPAAISLADPSTYVESLRNAKVWSEVATRKAEIERQIKAEAEKLGGTARIDAGLLDEVTALVEWPVVISGRIEERFLELPPEVIVATVETNQRYFTVFDDKAKLLPSFITIANIESKDVAQVVQGNERVVRPRLSDALFFWQQDLKTSFPLFGEKLRETSYQKDLGSVRDKEVRISAHASDLAIQLGLTPDVVRAGELCKHDLVTKMVYEFPELQGVIGGYYATKAGESSAVGVAIREHYLPTQTGTSIPSTIEGQIVALVDKLDTLAGIFAIGQRPTASKDPYALRRAALGVVRILIEGRLRLDLRPLLDQALAAQPAGQCNSKMREEMLEFVLDRLPAYLIPMAEEWDKEIDFNKEKLSLAKEGIVVVQLPNEVAEVSVMKPLLAAVKALGLSQPLEIAARIKALYLFQWTDGATSLIAAHKRVRNVLKQAGDGGLEVDVAKFESDAESALYAALNAVNAAPASDYTERLKQLAGLKAPVDAFFTGVMVMADDVAVRANRLALLRQLDRVCREVADISCLPG